MSFTNTQGVNMKGIPSLRVSVSARCNLRCLHCQERGDFSTDVRQSLFDPGWVKKTTHSISRFFKLGVRHFSITGGEPLCEPENTFRISALVRNLLIDVSATPQNSYLRINTDGIRILEYLPQIMDYFDLVKISLNSLVPERYAAIGQISINEAREYLKKVIAGIETLNKRGRDIRIQTVLTRINQEELWDIVQFASRFTSVVELKILDLSEYSHLWHNPEPAENYWRNSFVPLRKFQNQLKAKAIFKGSTSSIGGYGNPMPVYQLGKLKIRLRTSAGTVGQYHPTCKNCLARSYCRDGSCNIAIGPNELIKVCKPQEGRIFQLGQEEEALQYMRETRFDKTPE